MVPAFSGFLFFIPDDTCRREGRRFIFSCYLQVLIPTFRRRKIPTDQAGHGFSCVVRYVSVGCFIRGSIVFNPHRGCQPQGVSATFAQTHQRLPMPFDGHFCKSWSYAGVSAPKGLDTPYMGYMGSLGSADL